MSDSYDVSGVTVTPQGGGYYDLSHSSLPEPVRVRGKESAEERAVAIANSLRPDDDTHIEQDPIPAVTTVQVTEGEVPPAPTTVPREYRGAIPEAKKDALEKIGIKFVRIVLEENENIPPTGLYLGHNGRGYMIMPGVEVDVPDFLLGVLDDAQMSAPVMDSRTQKILGYRTRSRYPYRRV